MNYLHILHTAAFWTSIAAVLLNVKERNKEAAFWALISSFYAAGFAYK